MIDTVQVLFERQFNDVERSDVRVVLVEPASPATLDAFAAVQGVEAAEAQVSMPIVLEANGERYGTSLQAFETATTMHGFFGPGGEKSLPAAGLLVGDSVEDLLGVVPGDDVTIRVPSLDLAVTEEIAGFVDEPMGTIAYLAIARLASLATGVADQVSPTELAGSGLEFGAVLRLSESVEFDAVRADIEAVPGVVAVVSTRSIERMVNSIMGFCYVFIGVMLVFGGMLAFGIIFNTMSVNLAERQVEVATMEAAGVTEGRIARLITAENMVVTLIAIGPGLLLGFLVAQEFMAAYDSDQFTFTLTMRWTTLVLSALFILVVTLLSQWPGLREIRRLDIAKIVRERAV